MDYLVLTWFLLGLVFTWFGFYFVWFVFGLHLCGLAWLVGLAWALAFPHGKAWPQIRLAEARGEGLYRGAGADLRRRDSRIPRMGRGKPSATYVCIYIYIYTHKFVFALLLLVVD